MDELRMDRPTAAELLEITAETLAESVVPATAQHAQHHARIAANICRILARELRAGDPTTSELPADLVEIDDAEANQAYVQVLASVQAKLAINKPGYDNHGADEESAIIA